MKFSANSHRPGETDNPVRPVVYIHYELFHAFLTRFSSDTKPPLASVDKRSAASLTLSLSLSLVYSFPRFLPSHEQPSKSSVESSERTNEREREREGEREREIRGKRFRNLAALVRQGAKSLFSMWLLQKDRALPVGNINFRSTSFLFFFSLLSFFIFIRLSFLTF